MSFEKTHGTVLRLPDMNTALAIKHELLRDFPAAMAEVRDPCKIIAFKTGLTERGIQEIKAGNHLPSYATGLALEYHYGPIADLAGRIRRCEGPAPIEIAKRHADMRWYVHAYEEALAGKNGRDPMQLMSEIETVLTRLGRMA